ncbi:MAG: hypothetical protein QG622_1213, partial [Actinomycetota bacterium]|nr:hypothetical protein [Actinomycetota bacterium]
PVGGVVAWVTLPMNALAPRRSTEPEPVGAPPAMGMIGAPDSLPRQGSQPPTVNGRQASGGGTPSQLPARHSGRERPREPGIPSAPQRSAPVPAPPSAASVAPAAPVIIPPVPERSPMSGPIAFRRPPAGPGGQSGLTRRVRGAQLPDTGDAPDQAKDTPRPERSAQSVRGALQSFSAGRRTAAEVALGNTQPDPGPVPPHGSGVREDDAPTRPQPLLTDQMVAEYGQAQLQARSAPEQPFGQQPFQQQPEPVLEAPASDVDVAPGGHPLPRRVRGAQMPQTDLPTSAPAPGRTAAEVRAALSNFVAGRRAAEHED